MKRHSILIFLLFSFFQIQSQVAWNMELLGHFDDNTIPAAFNDSQKQYNDIWGYAANDREYAIVGSAAYIHFFDVTDPTNPVLIDQFLGGDTTNWRDMKTYGNYAYAVSEDTEEGLMIFDLNDLPNSVSLISQIDTHFYSAHNIFIEEQHGRMYVAGYDGANSSGLLVLDISTNPVTPQLIGNAPLIGYVHDVYVRDNIAYASHANTGFAVWDFANADNPELLAAIETQGYNHSSWLSEDGTFAVVADEVPKGFPLAIIDMQNVQNEYMEVKSYFQHSLLTGDSLFNTAHNPFIKGNYAYVSYYEDGVQIIDLTDPANPVIAGWFDTFPNNTNYQGYFGCWGVYPYLPSGNIIATDRKYGLHILKFNEGGTTASEDLQESDIAIFPNPSADGIFNILKNDMEGKNSTIDIFDLSGKNWLQQSLENSTEQIDLSFLPNGFYLGKIKVGEKEIVKKLVIAK